MRSFFTSMNIFLKVFDGALHVWNLSAEAIFVFVYYV